MNRSYKEVLAKAVNQTIKTTSTGHDICETWITFPDISPSRINLRVEEKLSNTLMLSSHYSLPNDRKLELEWLPIAKFHSWSLLRNDIMVLRLYKI